QPAPVCLQAPPAGSRNGCFHRFAAWQIILLRQDHSATAARTLCLVRELVAMPELPEVETVRRGLQPVMEGARFTKVEARRPDLRRPLPKDFVKRLEGRTVTGLGRRAKYLLADLSSGDVLMMHLGMSGSFRVAEEKSGKKGDETPGDFHHPRSDDRTH